MQLTSTSFNEMTRWDSYEYLNNLTYTYATEVDACSKIQDGGIYRKRRLLDWYLKLEREVIDHNRYYKDSITMEELLEQVRIWIAAWNN